MKKLRTTLILLTLVAVSSWIMGISSFASAAEPAYSDEYQQVLEYKVTDWNGTNGVEWYVWDFTDPVHRGFAGSENRGEIVVNLTETYNESSRLSYLSTPDPVPYGDISFNWRNGDLNFTATNISNTEMGYVLLLGYMNWFPGFIVPLDWEANEAVALAQQDVWAILCNVTITNNTDSVTYDFKQQTGSILQNTTLEYDLTSGVLLSAYTEFGNYWCGLQLNTFSIPGFYLPVLGIVTVVTLVGIAAIVKKKKLEK